MTNVKYHIGVDGVNNCSKGAVVLIKSNPDGTIQFVKTLKFWQRCKWLNKIRYKFFIWKISRRYQSIEIIKETNVYTTCKN